MNKFLYIALIAISQAANASEPVSGPGYCQKFDMPQERRLASTGKLSAMRKLRDYYIDCDLGKESQKALLWAKAAARKGTKEDRDTYEQLSKALVRPAE